jgi:phage terminase large subunit
MDFVEIKPAQLPATNNDIEDEYLLMIIPTTAFNKIATLKQPIRIIQGGTSAGKTFSILLYLIYFGLKKDMLISIVAESIPVLKRGAYKDFKIF